MVWLNTAEEEEDESLLPPFVPDKNTPHPCTLSQISIQEGQVIFGLVLFHKQPQILINRCP